MSKILTAWSLFAVFVLAGCNQRLPATDHASVAAIHSMPAESTPVARDETADATDHSALARTDTEASDYPAASSPEVAGKEVSVAPAATPAAEPQTQRPPADRTPRRPGDAEKVTFEDLNLGMQADVVYRPFMLTDRVKDLEDKRISISGYMHPGQLSQRGIKDFILLKNTQCKFGPGGQADHLANVVMKEGSTTTFTPSPVKIEGTLKIEPFQGPDNNTWYIYKLEGAQIK